MNANSGGIHVGDGIPTLIANTDDLGQLRLRVDPQGEPLAFDSAMLVGDSPLTMRATVITGNHVSETSRPRTTPARAAACSSSTAAARSRTPASPATTRRVRAGGVAAVGALAVLTFDDAPSS